MESIRGKIAIIGAADTEVGKVPQLGATALCVDAARRAMDNAGISKDQVDGLVTCNSMAEPYMYHAEAIAEYLQIFPRYCISANAGGGTTFSSILHAGDCHSFRSVRDGPGPAWRTVCARDCHANNQKSCSPQRVILDFETPYGATVPAYYALIARAHMDAYGTTPEQMAAVAVSGRSHAARNPAAQMREPISVEDVLNSRMIADPLHLLGLLAGFRRWRRHYHDFRQACC